MEIEIKKSHWRTATGIILALGFILILRDLPLAGGIICLIVFLLELVYYLSERK